MLTPRLAAALALFLCLPEAMLAQLTAQQVLSVRQVQEPRFSPDGGRVALTVSEAPKGSGSDRNIWIADAKSGEVLQFTNSPKSDSDPRWSPDGKWLAFLSDRTGTSEIWAFSSDGGEAAPLTDGKNPVQAFDWSPDGKRIAFLAPEPRTDEQEKNDKEHGDVHVADRDVPRARLWLLDVESRAVQQITKSPWQIAEMKWMPDGTRLVATATDHPEFDQNTYRIFSISASSGEFVQLAAPKGPIGRLAISPDGKTLAFAGARVDGPSAHDLYLLSLSAGAASSIRNLTAATIDRPVVQFQWEKSGALLATFQTGFETRMYRLAIDGTSTAFPSFDVNPGAFDVAPDGSIVFSGETTTQMPELWLANRQGLARKLTRFNDSLRSLRLSAPEFLKYKSFDGTMIEAMLLKPPDSKPGVRLPLVVLVHGGPTGRWSDSFEQWGQLLASRGYAVFYPNIRGSTGYGHSFIEMNRADWGGADYKDVLAGVDAMIDRGIADPAKLGIGGWSYGGYMAAWAVTQSDRFKAAVSGAPVIDMESEFGTESGPEYDEWFYGLPYEKPEGFVKSSPITYVKNVHTPTLLLQGEADTTDPIGQSQQFYRGLKRYGVKSELVLYPREGHALREEKHLLDRLNRIVDWFDSNLKPLPIKGQ